MKVEITDELIDTVSNNVYGAYWSRGMREDAGAIIKAAAPIIADQVLERARELAKPHGSRPCDCEQCYCDNPDDAAAVAVWDAQRYIDEAILALKEPTP